MPTQATSDKDSFSSEKDCSFSAIPAVLFEQGGRVSCLLRQSVCSDCSSGFTSQPSSGLPTPPPAIGHLTMPMFATGGHHCASEEGSGRLQHQHQHQRHMPVECTELDIHESFTPGEAGELQTTTGSGLETTLPRDNEPSLDLYSAAPSGCYLELHGCLKASPV